MKNFRILAAACAGLVLLSNTASAGLVISLADAGSGNQQQFAGSIFGNDLINDGQATLASVDVTNYSPGGSSGSPGAPGFVLNDGSNGGNLTGSNSLAAFDPDGDFQVTYNLDLSTNTLGYDLTRIRSYAAFGAARAGQRYEVLVDFVGGGATFVSLGTFSVADPGGFDTATRLTLRNDVNPGVDPFATGVAAIRFDMALAPRSSGPDIAGIWREFDVIGAATIPEPSSACLAALGLLGIAGFGRRRHT